jgi:thiamine biosynthesis protein ThiS
MKIIVNQEIIELNGDTITDLMNEQNRIKNSNSVVIVNKSIVQKNRWDLYQIKETDSIFIIFPTEGG